MYTSIIKGNTVTLSSYTEIKRNGTSLDESTRTNNLKMFECSTNVGRSEHVYDRKDNQRLFASPIKPERWLYVIEEQINVECFFKVQIIDEC